MSRPYKLFDSASALVFDGNEAVCFIVNLRNSVDSSRVKNITPGVLYTFIFHQSAEGGSYFTWPPECINAAPVDPAMNTTTVQNFIGDTGGTLKANLGGTWSPT